MTSLVPRLQVLAAAVLFSTGGAAIKACSLSGWQVASFRSAVACLVLYALMPDGRRGHGGPSLLVGAAYGATMVTFVISTKLTTAANAIFLQYTAPIYIVLLGPWLLNEALRARDLVMLAVLGCGLALFFIDAAPSLVTAPDPTLGNLLAVLSGVFWAATAVGLRWLARPGGPASPAPAAVAGNLMAFLACLPLALPVEPSRPHDWLVIGYLGTVQISGAYFFLLRGLRQVPAFEASMLLLLEPVLNPIWAWLIHGERPGPYAIAGAAVIFVATAFKTWNDRG
jgi:drug/metabolite transporter (DMT)-like permease